MSTQRKRLGLPVIADTSHVPVILPKELNVEASVNVDSILAVLTQQFAHRWTNFLEAVNLPPQDSFPVQSGKNGMVLKTDGTAVYWAQGIAILIGTGNPPDPTGYLEPPNGLTIYMRYTP